MSDPKAKQQAAGQSKIKAVQTGKDLVRKNWYKLDKSYRRSIIYTSLLHGVVVLVLTLGWQSKPEVKPVSMPRHINATVIHASTIDALNKKKLEQEKKKKAAVDKKKKAAEKKKRDARKKAEKKKKELKRKQAEKKRKADLKKKADAKKKALAKKKVAEKKKADAQKKALIKKGKAKKKKEEQRKQDETNRLKEKKRLNEKKAAEKKRLDELRRLKQEQQLLDMMLKAENDERLELEAERLREQSRIEQENLRNAQIKADRVAEMNEVDRFIALIRAKITRSWHKPQGAKNGQTVVLRLNLFPTGELSNALVIKGSGDSVFDRSALSAAKSVSRYPVPSDNRIFEKHFRQFSMSFSHQED